MEEGGKMSSYSNDLQERGSKTGQHPQQRVMWEQERTASMLTGWIPRMFCRPRRNNQWEGLAKLIFALKMAAEVRRRSSW